MIEDGSIWVCWYDSGGSDLETGFAIKRYVGEFKATVTNTKITFNVIQPNYSATYKRFIIKTLDLDKVRSDEYLVVGNEVVIKERYSMVQHKCGLYHHFYRKEG